MNWSTLAVCTALVLLQCCHAREKRSVIGKDDLKPIDFLTAQRFPYGAAVKFSSGCTGTLIWRKHVLTSAHCVHNRTHPQMQLKVGVMMRRRKNSFRWFSIAKIDVPKGWTRSLVKSLKNDYAVVTLTREHRKNFMQFGTHNVHRVESMQFFGFPKARSEISRYHRGLWLSECDVTTYDEHLVGSYCDSPPGMSGSGVYVMEANRNRKIFSVMSSNVDFSARRIRGLGKSVNFATRLTYKKVSIDIQKKESPFLAGMV